MKILLYSDTNETAHLIKTKSPIHPILFSSSHIDTEKHV